VSEVAEIFRRYGPAYQTQYGRKLLPSHHQAIRAMLRCRTPALGGQVYTCQTCQHTRFSYHSCRNRHCPKCQQERTQDWLAQQQGLLLPVPYFLLTFTVPEALRPVMRRHQKTLYALLFQASAQATQQLAQDPRFVGGQLGLLGVLQTWGRTLHYHPHVHYLVPGGGLDAQGQWRPTRKTFLLPVKALSRLFRAKFRDALRATPMFAAVPSQVWQQPWVVHCQPVGDGQAALKYLAPYIFRVALSNRRIVKVADGRVTFRYRPTGSRRDKTCTLSAHEFMRRFLQHVLPKGFVKVRYYGLFSPAYRTPLARLRQELTRPTPLARNVPEPEPAAQTQSTAPAVPGSLCPTCGGPMQRRALPPLHSGRPP
jgi:hypothetical protein